MLRQRGGPITLASDGAGLGLVCCDEGGVLPTPPAQQPPRDRSEIHG